MLKKRIKNKKQYDIIKKRVGIIMCDDEIWSLVGWVKVSPNKTKIIKALDENILTPTEIGKITGLRTHQVSMNLQYMKEKNIVVCLTENNRKGRLYKNTELGLKILKKLD